MDISKRLAVYGSLMRGKENHRLIDDLGDPMAGILMGSLRTFQGYLVFTWARSGQEVPVEIYTSENLTESRWLELDGFEGRSYRRAMLPVRLFDRCMLMCSVYVGHVIEKV